MSSPGTITANTQYLITRSTYAVDGNGIPIPPNRLLVTGVDGVIDYSPGADIFGLWSLFPALADVDMNGYGIFDTSKITMNAVSTLMSTVTLAINGTHASTIGATATGIEISTVSSANSAATGVDIHGIIGSTIAHGIIVNGVQSDSTARGELIQSIVSLNAGASGLVVNSVIGGYNGYPTNGLIVDGVYANSGAACGLNIANISSISGNAYGVCINGASISSVSGTSYGIYESGISTFNILEGNTTIGSLTPSPIYRLYVNGSTNITGQLSSNAVHTSTLYVTGSANILGPVTITSSIIAPEIHANVMTTSSFLASSIITSTLYVTSTTIIDGSTIINNEVVCPTASITTLTSEDIYVDNRVYVTDNVYVGNILSSQQTNTDFLFVLYDTYTTNLIASTISASSTIVSTVIGSSIFADYVSSSTSVIETGFISTLFTNSVVASTLTVSTFSGDEGRVSTLIVSSIFADNMSVSTFVGDNLYVSTLTANGASSFAIKISNISSNFDAINGITVNSLEGTGTIATGITVDGVYSNTIAIGMNIDNISSSGGGDSIGLYLGAVTGGANNYGIYQTWSYASNILYGSTTIGSINNPTAVLDVYGNAKISTQLTASSIATNYLTVSSINGGIPLSTFGNPTISNLLYGLSSMPSYAPVSDIVGYDKNFNTTFAVVSNTPSSNNSGGGIGIGGAGVPNASTYIFTRINGVDSSSSTRTRGDFVIETLRDTSASTASLIERLRVTYSGNVGIGTSSPRTLLEVNEGDLYITRSTSISTVLTIQNESTMATNVISMKGDESTWNMYATNSVAPTGSGLIPSSFEIKSNYLGNTRRSLLLSPGGSSITLCDTTASDPLVRINGVSGLGRVYDTVYNPPPVLNVVGGTNITVVEAPTGTFTVNYNSGGGGGTGLYYFLNNPSAITLAFTKEIDRNSVSAYQFLDYILVGGGGGGGGGTDAGDNNGGGGGGSGELLTSMSMMNYKNNGMYYNVYNTGSPIRNLPSDYPTLSSIVVSVGQGGFAGGFKANGSNGGTTSINFYASGGILLDTFSAVGGRAGLVDSSGGNGYNGGGGVSKPLRPDYTTAGGQTTQSGYGGSNGFDGFLGVHGAHGGGLGAGRGGVGNYASLTYTTMGGGGGAGTCVTNYTLPLVSSTGGTGAGEWSGLATSAVDFTGAGGGGGAYAGGISYTASRGAHGYAILWFHN